jgi:hypothetical protein
MASRISGFGDIHQGGGDGPIRRTEERIISLYIQYLITIARIGRETIPDRYIGRESLNSKGYQPPFHCSPRILASNKTM